MKLHPAVEAAERAVHLVCKHLRLYSDEARQLTRVEIDEETRDELFAVARDSLTIIDNIEEARRYRGPIKVRGVSYYVIHELPVPWRVISLGIDTAGRPCVEETTTLPRVALAPTAERG